MNIEANQEDFIIGLELQSTLKEPWRFHYPQETIQAIIRSPEKCMRLAQGLGLKMATPEAVQSAIEKAFMARHEAMVEIAKQRGLNSDYQTLKAEFNQGEVARRVNFICIVAHTLTPILMGDWRINRTEELKSQIGFDTIDLEEAVVEFAGTEADKYNDLVHVYFGPGNGAEMERLRDKSRVADKVREIGIGYALHFDPLSILESKMVEAGGPQGEGVKAFIIEAVRKALEDRWYKKKVSKGIQRTELQDFDCNDLYEIVASLPALIDAEPRRIPAHIEFENEHIEFVSADTYEALLRFQDVWSEPQIVAKVNIFKRDLLKYQIHDLGPQIEKDPKNVDLRSQMAILKKELQSLTQAYQSPTKPDLESDEAQLIEALKLNIEAQKSLGQAIKVAVKAKESERVVLLKQEGQRLAEEHKRLKIATADLYDSLDEPAFPISRQSLSDAQVQFLADFFTTDFLGQTHKSFKDRPDLNFEAEASPHNFIPSVFTDLDKYIPPQSVAIATDSRSESHQNDEDFETALRKKFATLRPGGVSVGDGFKQSFTRVMRFKQVQRAIADDQSLKAMVIVREEDHEPISIIVSKAREDGAFFVDSDDAPITLASGHYFADLDKTANRPDLRMLNRARKLLLQASIDESDVNIFRGNHDKIVEIVNGVVVEVAQAIYGEEQNAWSWVQEVITDATGNNIPNDMSRKMRSKLRTKITELINTTKAATSRAHMRGNRVILTPKGQLRLFARHEVKFPRGIQIDSQVSLDPSKLPHHRMSEEVLSVKREEVINGLRLLQEDGVENPLTMIDLSDCVTNQLLFEMLRDLEFGNFMQKTSIDLSRDQWPEERIAERIAQGGVFLVGGSWYDTYEGQGELFKKLIGPMFLRALEDPKSSFCYMGVCWGYQYMVDLIGEKYCEGLVRTIPGPLEIGPTPIRRLVTSVGPNHPLFNRLPVQGTVQMTRSGHVVDLRDEVMRASTSDYLRPTLQSDLTKHPAGMIGMDGRFVGIQNHSEINSDKAVQRVLGQMQQYADGLKRNFGIEVSDIRDNFELMFGSSRQRDISQDFSQALFLNSLNATVQRCLELRGLRR